VSSSAADRAARSVTEPLCDWSYGRAELSCGGCGHGVVVVSITRPHA
jgi:hypothetical protein